MPLRQTSREHTVVKVLRPRKKFVLLPFLFLIPYNMINSRRKYSMPDFTELAESNPYFQQSVK
jgi:hypothetical protein